MRLTELVTPLKPLEAMAQRKLVVASNVGGHRKLIEDGVTGTLFPAGDPRALADALDTLFANRPLWEQRRDRARAFVERDRNWSSNISNYMPAYQKRTDGAFSWQESIPPARGAASSTMAWRRSPRLRAASSFTRCRTGC